MANRIRQVNTALRLAGIDDRLKRGKGYYFFYGPQATSWYQSGVYVYRADLLTVEEWLTEYQLLKNDYRNNNQENSK